ncbi:MAG: hypothetical protein ACLQIB_12220 [Isosphaeraceae bacterium]
MSDSELPILKVSIPVSSTRRFTLLDAIILMAATAAGLALLGMYLAQGWFFGGAFFYGRFESYVLSGIEAVFPFLILWTFALVILRLRQPRPRIRRLARQPGMAACSAASLILVVQLLGIVPFEVFWCVRSVIAQARAPSASLPPINKPLGSSSPSAKTNGRYGAPVPPNSPASAGAASSLPQQGQPPGIFPSIPGLRIEADDTLAGRYIAMTLHLMHLHMIQRGYAAAGVAGAWLVLLLAGWWRPEASWLDRSGRVLGFLWLVPYLIYHAELSRLWH